MRDKETITIPLNKVSYEDLEALTIEQQTQLFVKEKEIEKLNKEKMNFNVVIRNEKPIQIDTQGLDYMVDLEQKYYILQDIIKEVREYITSYESIDTIQGLEDIEKNKYLDGKTLNEMVRRYMIVHDKLLEILDKVD